MQFELGQEYVRRSKAAPGKFFNEKVLILERGRVREIRNGKVLMDVSGPFPGVETFNPAHGASWMPC